jgi:hypothetical protein
MQKGTCVSLSCKDHFRQSLFPPKNERKEEEEEEKKIANQRHDFDLWLKIKHTEEMPFSISLAQREESERRWKM